MVGCWDFVVLLPIDHTAVVFCLRSVEIALTLPASVSLASTIRHAEGTDKAVASASSLRLSKLRFAPTLRAMEQLGNVCDLICMFYFLKHYAQLKR